MPDNWLVAIRSELNSAGGHELHLPRRWVIRNSRELYGNCFVAQKLVCPSSAQRGRSRVLEWAQTTTVRRKSAHPLLWAILNWISCRIFIPGPAPPTMTEHLASVLTTLATFEGERTIFGNNHELLDGCLMHPFVFFYTAGFGFGSVKEDSSYTRRNPLVA